MDLLSGKWRIVEKDGVSSRSAGCELTAGRLHLFNDARVPATFALPLGRSAKTATATRLRVSFRATATGAGACLYVNGTSVPMNATALVSVLPLAPLKLRLLVMSGAQVDVTELGAVPAVSDESLVEHFVGRGGTLVVTPAYPSSENLYLCAFVHARVREYVRHGLAVDVAAISPSYRAPTSYEVDGVRVLRGNYPHLEKLIRGGQYQTIVVHFLDESHLKIFDDTAHDKRLVFIVHGGEILFEKLAEVERPYFTAHGTVTPFLQQSSDRRRYHFTRYLHRPNTTWVFVSQWLKELAERQLGLPIENSVVIHNIINEHLFPYVEKSPELRKRILVLRKFDNTAAHAVDQVVLAIRELSRRPLFSDLSFSIFGDGNYFDELLAPVREFPNVHVHRTFLPQDKIAEVHREHGILLLPSRQDGHAVSMSEGASSGLVVVGSDVTSNGDFMNNAVNHTLAPPEDFKALAGIIQRLYDNPDEFCAISARMSAEIRRRCSVAETVGREIALIEKGSPPITLPTRNGRRSKAETPLLTIAVPAYNVETLVGQCLFSILNHRNVPETEVLVVNDGSTDGTAAIAHDYEARCAGVVRVIDKENGGHGSAINVAIREARGRFLRFVDGDDWVVSELLAQQIDRLTDETADLVLTDASYEHRGQDTLAPVVPYDNLHDGALYSFDDLTCPRYGFAGYGPTLPTSTFRTDCLRRANFRIAERCAYVDQELNAYSLVAVDTLRYQALDIYRYLIGREGQTVTRAAWATKFGDHRRVLFNIVRFVRSDARLSERKRGFIVDHILAPLVGWQIIMYDHLRRWPELDDFLAELGRTPGIEGRCLELVKAKRGDALKILKHYRSRLRRGQGAGESLREPQRGKPIAHGPSTIERVPWRKVAKALAPHGMLRIYDRLKR